MSTIASHSPLKRLGSKRPPIGLAYVVSNVHVDDNVTWPRKVKLVTPIRLEPNISLDIWDVSYIVCCRETVEADQP